jgi:predicted lipid-binding transport protein (Tim44 family)
VAAAVLLLAAAPAFARLGGGESFGGGGGGGGGGDGGGGDGGEIIFWILYILIRLCIECPEVGIPLTLVFVTGLILYAVFKKPSAKGKPSPSPLRLVSQSTRRKSVAFTLKNRDPNFSKPLFLDFIHLLYARVHEARGTGVWDPLRPYLMPEAIEILEKDRAARKLTQVDRVILGRSDIKDVSDFPNRPTFVTVELEANYTEHGGGGSRDYYVVENWTLRRAAGVLSPGPEAMRSLACPGCGSPVQLTPQGTCTFCGRATGGGRFQWALSNIRVAKKTDQEPPAVSWLGGVEQGTERDTIFDPEFQVDRRKFQGRHPEFSWEAFSAKVQHVFLELQAAWSSRDFEKARPYETDALFDRHRFWIERYRREGLTNRLEDIRIEKIQPCKMETDAFYEAITARVFATMTDWTEDAAGKVVVGSKSRRRRFSEYWTFIRRIGSKEGKKGEESKCPNCGADVKVNMAGSCEYCGSKVTTGDFDWVLSNIEQDDVYEG